MQVLCKLQFGLAEGAYFFHKFFSEILTDIPTAGDGISMDFRRN